MAKLNLELEIDWIDENMNLDDVVRDGIMSKIEKAVVAKINEKVMKDSEERIYKQVDELVTVAIKDRIANFLSTPRDITDKYGDVKRKNVTVEDLLKEQLESAMSMKTLDLDGKPSSYNANYSIFEFMASKNINRLVAERVAMVAVDTKKEIEQMVSSQIKANIADKLTNMIMENSTALSLRKGDDK